VRRADVVALYRDLDVPRAVEEVVDGGLAVAAGDDRGARAHPNELLRELSPRRVAADERVALTQLLVRWAIEVHGLYEASDGRRRERAG
jgi:hypothetical protein